jgi:triosephosphate isomerase
MREKIVAANWKMHGDPEWAERYCNQLSNALATNAGSATVIIFPPFPFMLQPAFQKRQHFFVGPQNFYPAQSGAYTGEVSLSMFPPSLCRYALVGHSERRHILHESEKFIAEKFHHAKEHDIVPVLCVGETDEERANGQTEAVLVRQIEAVARNNVRAFEDVVIAYEPVWAIGTGKTATPELAQQAHALIRQIISQFDETSARRIPVLYGGSVKPSNAEALFAMPDIDGGLIGGASREINQFLDIVKCIS